MRTTFLCLSLVLAADAATAAQPTVMIDDMTGTEVMQAVDEGKTTVILYIGGLHENTYSAEDTAYVGPKNDAVSINKHNLVAEYQARRIAEELGNALAYYPLPYTPARSHLKPGTAGGTIALTNETFAAVLREMAESAVVTGFKDIVFIGEDGGGQRVIKEVAETLDNDWANKGVDVFFFPVYADANKVTAEYFGTMDGVPADCVDSGIGGCISATTDASEVLFLKKENVRTEKISPAIEKLVSPELGRILNEQKVEIAVNYIRGVIASSEDR